MIYERVIRPAFYKYQPGLDSALGEAKDAAQRLANKAANQGTIIFTILIYTYLIKNC